MHSDNKFLTILPHAWLFLTAAASVFVCAAG